MQHSAPPPGDPGPAFAGALSWNHAALDLVPDATALHASTILDALDQAGNLVAVLEAAAPGVAGLRVVVANAALGRVLGQSPAALEGRPATFLSNPAAGAERLARLDAALAGQAPLHDDVACQAADGRQVWIGLHLMPAVTAAGAPPRYVLLGRDITEQRRHAAADLAMQALLGQAFQHAGVALALVAANGLVALVNRRFQALCGRPAAAIEGLEIAEQMHPADHASAIAQRERQLLDGLPYEIQARVLRPGGESRPVRLHAALIERRDLQRFRIVTLVEEMPAGPPPLPTTVALAGRVRLIGLEEVRQVLGERWPALAERALASAEHVLRRRLDERETFSRTSDGTGFVVCFAAGDEDEAGFRAATIAREIRARLIGEVEEPAVAAIHVITDPTPLTAPEVAELGAGLTQRLESRMAARQQGAEERARARLADAAATARCEITPLLTPRGAAVPLAMADLPQALRRQIEGAMLALPESETRGFDPTLLRLDTLVEALLEDPAGAAATCLLPINLDALSPRSRAERVMERLRAMPPALRQRLLPVLWQVPPDIDRARVHDALRLLRPFGRSVGLEIDELDAPPFDPKLRLASLVVVDAALLLRHHRRGAAPSAAVQRIRAEGARLLARGATEAMGAELVAAGADLVLPPPARRPPPAEPGGRHRLSRAGGTG